MSYIQKGYPSVQGIPGRAYPGNSSSDVDYNKHILEQQSKYANINANKKLATLQGK